MTMDPLEEEILKDMGWDCECMAPLEIRHTDGSFATGQAAHYVVDAVLEEHWDGHSDRHDSPAILHDPDDEEYKLKKCPSEKDVEHPSFKYVILVENEATKKEMELALRYLHDQWVYTGYVMVNQLTHEYRDPNKNNILVDATGILEQLQNPDFRKAWDGIINNSVIQE